ncbi:PXN1 protein, partial [Polypterus senegalus]
MKILALLWLFGIGFADLCTVPRGGTNIARQGIAEQSSPYLNLGAPSLAIDGKTSGVFSDWSCTHTSNDAPSWWRLNLKTEYAISVVVVYNRLDCCDTRLMGAEVRVGETPDVSTHVKCGTIEATSPGSVHTICCNGKRGQFVSVVLPNQPQHLTLCEVEVYGVKTVSPCRPAVNAINIARQGIAEQSSPYGNLGPPNLAIDGKASGVFGEGTCTHTNNDSPSWWRLNLKASYAISTVMVYNRLDCCDTRLMGAEVRVGDSPDVSKHVKCGTIEVTSPGSIHTICCHEKRGQFVSVVLPNQPQYLTLCEVEVYGEEIVSPSINIARQGIAEQSSPYLNFGGPNLAIDGKTSGVFSDWTCTHTSNDSPSWWRLNLKASYAVSIVVVYNRLDCCDTRLTGAEVRVGDSPDVSKHTTCGTIEATFPGSVHTICCDELIGQYVSIVLPNQPQYLTLCEVEIYGEAITPECKPGLNAINIARQGTAEQSSPYLNFGGPNLAIDGNRSGIFNDWTCTHTSNDSPSWWRLKLKASYDISIVVVYNRLDCCDKRLTGAEVRVGDSPDVSEHDK